MLNWNGTQIEDRGYDTLGQIATVITMGAEANTFHAVSCEYTGFGAR